MSSPSGGQVKQLTSKKRSSEFINVVSYALKIYVICVFVVYY